MPAPSREERAILAAYRRRSGARSVWLGWLVLAAMAAALAGSLPGAVLDSGAVAFFLIMGAIGLWRYSWASVHLARAFWYRRVVFPRIRAAADALGRMPSHLYVVVTSFRMPAAVNAAVYGRLADEIAACGVGATIVACVTDPADLLVLRRVLDRRGGGRRLRLLPVYQSGKGKRHAVAAALDIVAAEAPLPGSQVVLMDGDTLLGPDCLRRAGSVLAAHADLGAVTTENVPLVEGPALEREWYRLRMAQRDNLMCSVSLSRKLLVLTGRLSIFRAELAVRPEFILAVRSDVVRHWRLGRIALLTGDDKSTWFALLRAGWNMLYVPDAVAHPLERMPRGGFLPGTVALMSRWYGNMVRANGRAVMLGPRRTGLFLWLCLVDQRLSMWTTLIGPTFATLAALLHSPAVLVVYGLWVLATRSGYCLLLAANTGRLHPLFPLLLYYTQFVGSAVKVFMSFHPYRQEWTRQGIAAGEENGGLRLVKGLASGVYGLVMLVAFVLLVAHVGDLAGMAAAGVGE